MPVFLISILMCAILAVACDAPPEPRLTKFRVERGNVKAQYDDKTGRMKKLDVDVDKNGKTDTYTYMDGTRIDRIEIDKNEDGKIERWEYYVDNKLEKVGTSTRGDGVVDEWAYQTPAGNLLRVETDTDRDGRVDKWETFDPPTAPGGSPVLRTVTLATDPSGQPSRRLIYGPDGAFQRVEKIDASAAPKQ
jgi:hypothetical protein